MFRLQVKTMIEWPNFLNEKERERMKEIAVYLVILCCAPTFPEKAICRNPSRRVRLSPCSQV
jgi:hypothetical protein